MTGLRVITPPTVEPVTLDEVKTWCRIDATGDTAADTANDVLLTSLVAAARGEAEDRTKRSFLPQTLELTLGRFPFCGKRIELPRPPLVSITSITYFDAENVSSTMGASAYVVVDASDSIPPTIIPSPDTYWPDAYRRPDAVAIRYATGWPDAASVPENIKTWIKVRVATLWANRENIVAGNVSASAVEMPNRFLDSLLDRWTIKDVA